MKKNSWSLFLLNGAIAVLFGLLFLIESKETLTHLIRYFGILMLIAGAVMMAITIGNMKKNKSYMMMMVYSIVILLFGAYITFFTQSSLKIFVIIIGVWAALVGLMQIIVAVRMRGKVSNHMLFTVNGIITLVVGLLLMFYPIETMTLMVKIIGLLALVSGVLMIYLGIKIKTSAKLE